MQRSSNRYDVMNAFQIYHGTHTIAVAGRFQNQVMPFFSRNLCLQTNCQSFNCWMGFGDGQAGANGFTVLMDLSSPKADHCTQYGNQSTGDRYFGGNLFITQVLRSIGYVCPGPWRSPIINLEERHEEMQEAHVYWHRRVDRSVLTGLNSAIGFCPGDAESSLYESKFVTGAAGS